MRKLKIFVEGKDTGQTIEETPGGGAKANGQTAEYLKLAAEQGRILNAGEKIKDIFAELPQSLDGAYLAAELVTE